jgi:hypothetical protein
MATRKRNQGTSRSKTGQNPAGQLPEKQNIQPPPDPNRVDVTGKVPEGVHPDPNITEGHPGYQESGSSELTPPA